MGNKAETVLADSQYVLRTSHSVAKSQLTCIPTVELGMLVTRPWHQCSARARGRHPKRQIKVTETLLLWEGGKRGFNKITLMHYYSNKNLQCRPSLTLSSLHVNTVERQSASHLLLHTQEWCQDPLPATGVLSLHHLSQMVKERSQ